MTMKTRIMVIVGVGVLLVAVVCLPDYIKSRTVSSKNSCIAWLMQIDAAKATWALEHQKTTNDIPTEAELYGAVNYLRDVPTCPQGGRYTIGRLDERPRCSFPGHDLAFGYILVVDESGAPLAGVGLEVRNPASSIVKVQTADDKYVRLTPFPASMADDWLDGTKVIIVTKKGYRTQNLPMATNWPLRVVLKKDYNN